MRRHCLGLLTVVAFAASAPGDILPPNSKWVNHVVHFENFDKFPDYVFYVYPRDLGRGRPGNSSVRVPESGEVHISGLNPLATRNGVFLFAVPKKLLANREAPAEEWFEGKVAEVLKSGPLVHPIRTTAKSDKRDRIVTTYRIAIKDKLTLSEVKTPKPESKPDEPLAQLSSEEERSKRIHWIIGGGAAGMGIVCATWLALRKKI